MPLASFVLENILIELPFASVSVKTVLVNVAVKLGILAALMSVAMSSGMPTAIPYAACPAALVVNDTVVLPPPPLKIALKGVYPPTNPYAVPLATELTVVGAGEELATILVPLSPLI